MYFVDIISSTISLDSRPCFTSVEFADFVNSRKGSFSFVIEIFLRSGTILFSCFNDGCYFAYDKNNCFHNRKRPFFTCRVDDERIILRKCYLCHRKSLIVVKSTFSALHKMKVTFKKFSNNASSPTQGTKDSADYDLYSVKEKLLCPYSSVLLQTDVWSKIPKRYFGKIHLHSTF